MPDNSFMKQRHKKEKKWLSSLALNNLNLTMLFQSIGGQIAYWKTLEYIKKSGSKLKLAVNRIVCFWTYTKLYVEKCFDQQENPTSTASHNLDQDLLLNTY